MGKLLLRIKLIFGIHPNNLYCKRCTACGESGCCSPLSCDLSGKGMYCDTYKTELRETYENHNKMMGYIECKIIALKAELKEETSLTTRYKIQGKIEQLEYLQNINL